ncbi:hypothetical protein [Granulicoccus sp. GXG6511]|uniref:hypothetical protein n=1 Tax=Granulicoccus sp. GXG6511 TaxID=3381351 RepID=UPI003D7CE033
MGWILAIAVSPARTWAARAPLASGPAEPELIRLAPVTLTHEPAPGAPESEPEVPSSVVAGPVAEDTADDSPAPVAIRTEGMPSAVWSDGERTLVGVAALDQAGLHPEGLVLDPYALISGQGPDSPHPVADGKHDPVELVAALLREAYQLSVDHVGSPPDRTLVTHPDGWTGEQILTLRRAADRVGIRLDPVPEPIAVAAAYRAFGGEGTRLLMLDADRNTASALARMGNMFIVLGTAGADDNLAAPDVLPRLANEALEQPGVRRELLDDVLVTGESLEAGLADIGTTLLRRPATELPSWVLAPGALHYDRSLHEVPPEPAPAPPPPPPPPPPVPRINHAAPAKKKRLQIVPLLILILVVLVLAELLFIYWPF